MGELIDKGCELNQLSYVRQSPNTYTALLANTVLMGLMLASFYFLKTDTTLSKYFLLSAIALLAGHNFSAIPRSVSYYLPVFNALLLFAFVLFTFTLGTVFFKLSLLVNIAFVLCGLIVGPSITRSQVICLAVATLIFVVLDFGFAETVEGRRLNNAYIFLGLYCLVSPFFPRASIVLAMPIIFTFARTVTVSMMLIMAARVKWRSPGILFAVFSLPLILVSLLETRLFYTHGSGRFSYWEQYFTAFMSPSNDSYLFGVGVGHVFQRLRDNLGFGGLHNEWLRILVETGIIGFICFSFVWFILYRRIRFSFNAKVVFITILLSMFFDNSLSYSHYLLFASISISYMHNEARKCAYTKTKQI